MPRQITHTSWICSSTPQTVQIPLWQALPDETRRLLIRLLVRLILDHVDGDQSVQREGTDHDA